MGVCLTSEGTMVVGSQEELVSLLRATVLQAAPLFRRRVLLTRFLHYADFRFSFLYVISFDDNTVHDTLGLFIQASN